MLNGPCHLVRAVVSTALRLGPCRLAEAVCPLAPRRGAADDEGPRREQGPWRWRYLWPRNGRPGGMALLDREGNTLLWVPGGFADPFAHPDGRPSPSVAAALAAAAELEDALEELRATKEELAEQRRRAADAERLARRAITSLDDGLELLGAEAVGGPGSDAEAEQAVEAPPTGGSHHPAPDGGDAA